MTILPFNSPYAHGFVRAVVATPRVRVADPRHNGRQVIDLARTAADDHACLVVFPELGLSGYSNEDLFLQDALLDGVLAAQVAMATPLNVDVLAGMGFDVPAASPNDMVVALRLGHRRPWPDAPDARHAEV